MTKIYIGGSLFSEAEIAQRLKEEDRLRDIYGDSIDIFNPINSPQNCKDELPTSQGIFNGDTKQIMESDVMLVDISNQSDAGVFCELGIAWACNFVNHMLDNGMSAKKLAKIMKPKHIITHLSDIRKGTSNKYSSNYIPWGFNQYAIGMIEDGEGIVADNLQEALTEIRRRVSVPKDV